MPNEVDSVVAPPGEVCLTGGDRTADGRPYNVQRKSCTLERRWDGDRVDSSGRPPGDGRASAAFGARPARLTAGREELCHDIT